MSSTKTNIINLALIKCGRNAISSLSEDTEDNALASAIYDHYYDIVIAEGYYACTIRRASLAQLSTTPAFGYTYEYELPSNPRCLKVLEINELDPKAVSYTVEGNKLLISDSSVKIVYKASIDENDIDIYLQDSLVNRIAAELCYALTGDKQAAQMHLAVYEAKRKASSAHSSSQGSSRYLTTSDILSER